MVHQFSRAYRTDAFVATILSTEFKHDNFFVETESGKIGTSARNHAVCMKAASLTGQKVIIRTRIRHKDGKVFFHSAEAI